MAFKGDGGIIAHVNFNGVSDAIRHSMRVSSITDIGNADYQVNFSSSFPTASYSWAGAGARNSNDPNSWCGEFNGSRGSSSMRIRFFDNSASQHEPDIAMCIYTCNDFS